MSLMSNVSMLNNALRTFQYGMNVTSNNITNATTPGYSRQLLDLQTAPIVFDGSLGIGNGVDATGIQRVRDTFLDSRIKFEQSELGRSTAEQEALTELAAIFPEVASASATTGLKGAIDNVVAQWTALAAAPGSAAAQAAVSGALRSLADMLQTDARKTFDLQVRINDQVDQTLAQVNSLLDQIAGINKQLKALGGTLSSTGAPNALLDLREQAAEQLAQLIGADFRTTYDGMMNVSIGVGDLVTAGTARHLTAISSPTDPGRTDIGYSAAPGIAAQNVTSSITSGTLGGLLSVRDTEVEGARLDLNRIAYGIISRTNEINQTFTAGDGTSQHSLLLGTSAADIVLDPIINSNPSYVGGTRDVNSPGDLAKIQAQLENFIQFSSMRTAPGFTPGVPTAIDPTQPLSTQTFAWGLNATTPLAQGSFVISTTGNAASPILWDQTETLNQIIAKINANGSGAYYATFDASKQQLIIVGQTPMTVYDTNANFLEVFGISSVVTSSAPINNYPVPGLNQVDPWSPMNNTQNTLNIFSSPVSTGGTVLVDGNAVNWTAADDISGTINGAISGATAPPTRVGMFFNTVDQTVTVYRTGDPFSANSGVLNFGLGNAMQSVQIVDQKGNLTQSLNLNTNTNANKILDEMITTVGSRVQSEGVLVQQAQALVDQTQALQDAQSKVDLNAELAQATLYQRSYEASVRMQFILDEMLNVLINHTGSSASGGTAI